MKRLNINFGSDKKKSKCVQLHVGKNSHNCIALKANGKELNHVSEATYLGDIVSGDGSNHS